MMQILLDVVVQRPIMSMEQFLEKVSWPGTLPSLVREGGGPNAQVPQQVQDASFEAIIPKPFVGEACRSQMRQEAATPERSPQVTPDPPSLVVDQSSPQQPADPPTPVHEMPVDPPTPVHEMPVDPPTPVLEIQEEPATPVLRLTITPPVTPVLHYTDEEDTQDQDTQQQDQPQEF